VLGLFKVKAVNVDRGRGHNAEVLSYELLPVVEVVPGVPAEPCTKERAAEEWLELTKEDLP